MTDRDLPSACTRKPGSYPWALPGHGVSEPTRAPAAYDCHTSDHGEIRDWVTERGGQPVELQDPDAEELAVVFDGLDRAIGSPLEWERFFERFEELGFAFAYDETSDDPGEAWALFDRTRVEASNRIGEEGSDAGEQPTGGDGSGFDVEADPSVPGDGRSGVRHEEATDQENADNHRDEPPFES